VVVVTEGAYASCGDYHQYGDAMSDKSGNMLLFNIIPTLVSELEKFAKSKDISPNILTLDPTYIVRSDEVNNFDRDYCSNLAIDAAHSAMSGFNGVMIGIVNQT